MPKIPTTTVAEEPKTTPVAEEKKTKKRKKKEEGKKSETSEEKEKKEETGTIEEESAEREIVYPDVRPKLFAGDNALTEKTAKKLIGWEPASENAKEGVRVIGTERVFLHNNVRNRPIYPAIYLTLKQSILRRRWKVNGESIIVGRTGIVLNSQHTLLALILAVKEWKENPDKWLQFWETEPTIEKTAWFGIEETDEVVNTIDTAKPRTLTDVIYRSEYFQTLTSEKDRKHCAKRLAYAVQRLWDRTGAKQDAYAPIRTHMESIDFINRHGRVLEAVKHIYEEDGTDQRISRYISPGYAAAAFYLMGTSATERENEHKTGYIQVRIPSEEQLDFSNWDTAANFWVELAGRKKTLAPLNEALGTAYEQGYANVEVRWALVAKAWLAYVDRGEITEEDLQLEFTKDEDTGAPVLQEYPSVGGIDLGKTS